MKNIILMSLVALVSACALQGNEEEDVLPSEDMINILIDVHILEAKLTWFKEKPDSISKIYNSFEKEIFKEHGVDKATYEKSFAYYLTHPAKMEQIYAVVVDSLNVMEQRLMLEIEEEKKSDKQKREERKNRRNKKKKKKEAPNVSTLPTDQLK